MSVLVVKLALTSVIAPGLGHTKTDFVLRTMDVCEVLRDRGLNEVPQLRHLAIAQDEVVHARGVAHIGPSILTRDKIHLTLGQVSTELEERHRRWE
jgi:hypothetical protein